MKTGDRLRYAPEAFSLSSEAFQQLQWTLSSTTQPGGNAALLRLLGARVLVYWRESSSWFPGSIVQVGQQHSALQVEYDDGDLRWEPVCPPDLSSMESQQLTNTIFYLNNRTGR